MPNIISQAMSGPDPSGEDYRLAIQLLQQGSHGYLNPDTVRKVQMKLIRGLLSLPGSILGAAILLMDAAEATLRCRLQATADQAQEMKLRFVFFSEVNNAFSPDPDDKRQQESDNSMIVHDIQTMHLHLVRACDAIVFIKKNAKAILDAHYLATHHTPPLILPPTAQKSPHMKTSSDPWSLDRLLTFFRHRRPSIFPVLFQRTGQLTETTR